MPHSADREGTQGNRMSELIQAVARIEREDGQSLAEYSLILAFIAAACVIALTALGLAISGAYSSIVGSF